MLSLSTYKLDLTAYDFLDVAAGDSLEAALVGVVVDLRADGVVGPDVVSLVSEF